MVGLGVIKINKSCSLSLKSSWPTEFGIPRDDVKMSKVGEHDVLRNGF